MTAQTYQCDSITIQPIVITNAPIRVIPSSVVLSVESVVLERIVSKYTTPTWWEWIQPQGLLDSAFFVKDFRGPPIIRNENILLVSNHGGSDASE